MQYTPILMVFALCAASDVFRVVNELIAEYWTAVGVPTVNPSTDRLTIWSAPGSGSASSSSSRSGAPIQRALPTYGPPTWFETQVSVMSRSMSGRDRSRS